MEQPSLVERYGSIMVDIINILLIIFLMENIPSYLVKFIGILIPVVYFPLLHTLFSRTIGDLVFKLRVVDQQGNKIGPRFAMRRFFMVLKFSMLASLLSNLLFVFLILFSGTVKDMSEVLFNFEEESKTYLVKAS